MAKRCRRHPNGDLEAQLVADGVGSELRELLTKLDIRDAHGLDEDELIIRLRKKKSVYAEKFAMQIRGDRILAQRTLEAFRDAVNRLPGLT